jgi:hypothetical protein
MLRCGHGDEMALYEDDEPTYQYEIVECFYCGATWAFDYDEVQGNVECPRDPL